MNADTFLNSLVSLICYCSCFVCLCRWGKICGQQKMFMWKTHSIFFGCLQSTDKLALLVSIFLAIAAPDNFELWHDRFSVIPRSQKGSSACLLHVRELNLFLKDLHFLMLFKKMLCSSLLTGTGLLPSTSVVCGYMDTYWTLGICGWEYQYKFLLFRISQAPSYIYEVFGSGPVTAAGQAFLPYFDDWLVISASWDQAQSPLLYEPVTPHSELQQRQPYTQSASSLSGHVFQLSVKYRLFLWLDGM